jgi:hypothetical protein
MLRYPLGDARAETEKDRYFELSVSETSRAIPLTVLVESSTVSRTAVQSSP